MAGRPFPAGRIIRCQGADPGFALLSATIRHLCALHGGVPILKDRRLRLAVVVASSILGITTFVVWSVPKVPRHLAPWAPLAINDPVVPGVTGIKMHRMMTDRPRCEAALASAAWRTAAVPLLAARNGGCNVQDAIRIDAAGNPLFSSGFAATCPLTVSLAMVIHHVVQPAARKHFNAEVVRVEHLGTFACRKVNNGRESTRMSQHAAANAIDITGFVLKPRASTVPTLVAASGKGFMPVAAVAQRTAQQRGDITVSVLKDWGSVQGKKEKSAAPVVADEDLADGRPKPLSVAAGKENDPLAIARAAFLREVRDGACQYFQAVLSPDYNRVHRSHFHFDMGPWKACK